MKKVCIFDIDNTITHGENATSKTCCSVGDMCMLDKVRPAWPDKSGSTTYIKEAVDNCVANGYELAIATAESGQESVNVTQQNFINSMFPKIYGSKLYQNACTAQGYKGSCKNPKSHPCCTTEYKDKTKMYLNIADTLGIKPENFGNSIVFDDDMSNLATANKLGFKTCQASTQCGGSYCDKGCGIGKNCAQLPNFLASNIGVL